jgi:hypothetical protein
MEYLMDVLTSGILTPARIVALTPIVILIGSLLYLRLTPGPKTVCIPANAKSCGLSVEPCDFRTENNNYAADCVLQA